METEAISLLIPEGATPAQVFIIFALLGFAFAWWRAARKWTQFLEDLHQWHKPVERDGALVFPWHNRQSVEKTVNHVRQAVDKLEAVVDTRTQLLQDLETRLGRLEKLLTKKAGE